MKAPLLYADRVELCSVGSSVLSGIAEFEAASPEARARLVVRFLPDLQPSMSPHEIRFFEATIRLRSREEKRKIPKKTRKKLLAMVEEQQGALEIYPFRQATPEALVDATSWCERDPLESLDLADVLEEVLEQAMGAAEDGFTYPLFDYLTGDFAAEAVRRGLVMVSEAAAHRGRHGELAGDLLQRLPTFEEATLAEILDVRRRLEGPLRGVRVVVAGFSREVCSAAWEPGLAEEANALFREKVESEVERIEHPYGRTARSRSAAGGSCAGSRDLHGTRRCMASVSHSSHSWTDSPPTSLVLSCRTIRQRGTAWLASTGPRPSPDPATSQPPVVAGSRYLVAGVESDLQLGQHPRPCSK